MKAKKVYENIDFRRGLEPKTAMELGDARYRRLLDALHANSNFGDDMNWRIKDSVNGIIEGVENYVQELDHPAGYLEMLNGTLTVTIDLDEGKIHTENMSPNVMGEDERPFTGWDIAEIVEEAYLSYEQAGINFMANYDDQDPEDYDEEDEG